MKDDFPNFDAIFDEKAINLATRGAKISAAKKGKGYTISEETKAKMAAGRVGMVKSEEAKAKMRAALKGRKMSEETRAKMSASQKGIYRPKRKGTCPHCQKVVDLANLAKYHGNKCKLVTQK